MIDRLIPEAETPSNHLNDKRAYPVRYGVMGFLLLAFSVVLGILSLTGYWTDYLNIFIRMMSGVLMLCSFGLFIVTGILIRRQYRDRSILSEIFEGSSSARLLTDIQDRTLFYNSAFEDLCTECEEKNLNVIRNLFSKTGDENVMERLEGLIQNAIRGHDDNMEVAIHDNTGTRWFRLAAQPVAGWLGTIYWCVDDISDRRAIETVIREEREKLVDFTDNAPVGFYSMDETGRFTFVNATLARWLGSDIDTLLKQGFLHSYLENPPQNSRPFDIVSDGGVKQVAELAMKGPAGRTFKAAVNQSVVHETDEHVRVRGVVHDLTSEREMREALRESEDRFMRFFHEAPLGIVMIDNEGMILDANNMFSEMIGEQQDKISGLSFIDFVTEGAQKSVQEKLSFFDNEKHHISDPIDIDLQKKNITDGDDETIAVQMHASRFKGDHIALRLFDRREQKTLEAQFTQSQKMQAVGQLAGGVAHDFNNLLTAIIGFCDLLLLRHKAGDPSFNDIMQIKQNSNRAANLVRQLLAFSRQQQLNPKVLDVTETLTELSHLIRRLIGVQIDFDLVHSPILDPVKVDEGQFEQVLINLAVNARDAMGGKGHLEIETENLTTMKPRHLGDDTMPPGHWVAIHVRDSGCGIDDQTMKRIFEPFFTTKDIGAGTGLGLATVYGIVRQTGGYIEVQSVVGKGTTFSLYFPKHVVNEKEESPQNVEGKKIQEDLTGTATVLLVEDEDAVRMFSARALANKGYHVLEAVNGESALEVIEDHDGKLDVMVTDVIMPEMGGPTLAKEVIKIYPDLPIIFVSGYTEDRFKEEIGENAHFLPKPFSLQQLAEKVKEVLS